MKLTLPAWPDSVTVGPGVSGQFGVSGAELQDHDQVGQLSGLYNNYPENYKVVPDWLSNSELSEPISGASSNSFM